MSANAMQKAVSKNKRRFKDKKLGFDLDLSYITKRIIAMGFPSEKREALYRNPMTEVTRFFEKLHPDNYYIYNLCAEKERIYDTNKFNGRVAHFPFYDHNAPPINLIDECCKDIQKWLEDPEHMVGIHCKAGKGRTGLIICCYLMFDGTCSTSDDALVYYGNKRTIDGKGVTIASQKRYIRYYERVLKEMDGIIPPASELVMSRIRITCYPKKELPPGEPFITIEIDDKLAHKSEYGTITKLKKNGYKADIPVDGNISGDCKIQLIVRKKGGVKQKLCHFWFNTGFIIDNKLTLPKSEIDVANKDKKCKIFKEDFAIEIFFKEADKEKNDTTEESKSNNKEEKVDNSSDDKNNNNHVANNDSEEVSDDKPKTKEKNSKRKSFYDYSDYGDLQKKLEFSDDQSDEDNDNEE
jgi:phosphatidylinositol-3,4,5-trisphosphate 3-phosphatase/dual-specificity protein phosphatase PTEN